MTADLVATRAYIRSIWPRRWQRDRQILAMKRAGAANVEIARRFALSRERVRQILSKPPGAPSVPPAREIGGGDEGEG